MFPCSKGYFIRAYLDTIQMTLRYMSGCALFKSAKHSNREVVYVGGGDNAGKTAEILDYTVTDQWEQGKF